MARVTGGPMMPRRRSPIEETLLRRPSGRDGRGREGSSGLSGGGSLGGPRDREGPDFGPSIGRRGRSLEGNESAPEGLGDLGDLGLGPYGNALGDADQSRSVANQGAWNGGELSRGWGPIGEPTQVSAPNRGYTTGSLAPHGFGPNLPQGGWSGEDGDRAAVRSAAIRSGDEYGDEGDYGFADGLATARGFGYGKEGLDPIGRAMSGYADAVARSQLNGTSPSLGSFGVGRALRDGRALAAVNARSPAGMARSAASSDAARGFGPGARSGSDRGGPNSGGGRSNGGPVSDGGRGYGGGYGGSTAGPGSNQGRTGPGSSSNGASSSGRSSAGSTSGRGPSGNPGSGGGLSGGGNAGRSGWGGPGVGSGRPGSERF